MGFFEYLVCFYCIVIRLLLGELDVEEEIILEILWVVVDVKFN